MTFGFGEPCVFSQVFSLRSESTAVSHGKQLTRIVLRQHEKVVYQVPIHYCRVKIMTFALLFTSPGPINGCFRGNGYVLQDTQKPVHTWKKHALFQVWFVYLAQDE